MLAVKNMNVIIIIVIFLSLIRIESINDIVSMKTCFILQFCVLSICLHSTQYIEQFILK